MKRYFPALLFLVGVFGVSAYGYYGGSTLNHGHTSTPGDGGPLTNPVVTGTGTFTGLKVGTIVVSGRFVLSSTYTVPNFRIAQSTITNLRVTGTLDLPLSNPLTTINGSVQVMTLGSPNLQAITLGMGSVQNGSIVPPSQANINDTGYFLGLSPLFKGPANTGQPQTSTVPWAGGAFQELVISSGIVGVQNGSSASSGYVGEYLDASVVRASAVSATGTTQLTDVTSISLTPGDWDVTGIVVVNNNSATATYLDTAISTTSGNSSTGIVGGNNLVEGAASSAIYDNGVVVPNVRFSLSTTTTIYLKFACGYTGGPPKAYGRISARRVR